MAVKFINGEYHFDSVEEAAKFERLTAVHRKNGSNASSGLSAVSLRAFFSGLKKNQKRLVKAMLAGDAVVDDAKLRSELKLENNKEIGGIMAGISRRATSSGFSIDALWTSEAKYSDSGERFRQFLVSEAFRKLAKEIGEIK